jgi:subtilisin family serine protease
MRRSRSAVVYGLLLASGAPLLLSACGHAPLPTSMSQTSSSRVKADAARGRVVVHWRDAAARSSLAESLSLGPSVPINEEGDEAVWLPIGQDVSAFRLSLGKLATSVEPDFKMRLPVPAADSAADMRDTERIIGLQGNAGPRQYALRLVHAAEAWRVTRGSPDVKIAIIDSGIDDHHPDLTGQVADETATIGARGKIGLGSPRDDNGHGTHCAGVAAASGANGVSGIAPGCKLLIAKTLDLNGAGETADIARGVNWAVDHGASVISMSMGGADDARPLRQAIERALSRGVVVVAAMGNEGQEVRNFPAAYPGVIAVGATTASDHVAKYSTRGPWISVCAPGSGILSTTPTYGVTLNSANEGNLPRGYGKLSGTSMATPLVAGIAALVKCAHPNWSPAQIKGAIETSASALGNGFDSRGGHGRIDAAAAVGANP